MTIWQNNPNIRDIDTGGNGNIYTNTSLVRATNILLCLSNGINTNTEIAKYCKYSTSTVHRLLNVLKNLNWIVQDSVTNKYYLGTIADQITSNQSSNHRFLLVNALHEMGYLSNYSGETINLSILVGLRSILLHGIHSNQELKITEADSAYGMLFAVGATCKALLAQLNEEEVREVLHKIDLAKVTENRIKGKSELLSQLQTIKRQGYAISYGERIAEAVCVSAVIRNYSHPVALSVLGPESRLKPRLEDIKEELLASAGRISSSLMNTSQRGARAHSLAIENGVQSLRR
jgi:DNA-binding IclR family transcriptional regulator